jgi:type IV pilus assembly protein PilM
LSKGLVETIVEVFKSHVPLWACEFTSKHVILAGVNSRRSRIVNKAAVELPASGTLESAGPPAGAMVQHLLSEVGFKGSEIAVVIPDSAARIAFLTAEKLSKNAEEQRTFIRWKLKKSIPFDVDTAQVAYRILGPHRGGPGVDMLVALSPRSVVQEYETLFDSLDIHAGMVVPSTLAALNLVGAPAGDTLFVKLAPDCVTTTVFQDRRLQFYRRVTDASLYDAIFPTVLYYQDKLGGVAFQQLCVCGYDADLRAALDEVQEKLGLVPARVEPKSVEDIYKPVLGAIQLKSEGVL